jgi:hypothetical protein
VSGQISWVGQGTKNLLANGIQFNKLPSVFNLKQRYTDTVSFSVLVRTKRADRMWKTFACLLGLLLAAANGFDKEVAKEKITSYRLRSQNLHVDHIEKELDKLEAELDALSEPVEQEQVQRVKARIKKLERRSSIKFGSFVSEQIKKFKRIIKSDIVFMCVWSCRLAMTLDK